MIARVLTTLLLALLLIGGIIAAFYVHAIESALMPAQMTIALQSMLAPSTSRSPKAVSTAASQPIVRPTPMATESATATATAMPMDAIVLARDTFQRASQAFWGTASDGQNWQGDANQAPAFSIVNGTGQIIGNHEQNTQTYNALLGAAHSDVNIVASGTVNQFGNGVNFGVTLRWTNTDNWYKALIDGTNLTILKRVDGITTQLGSIHFPANSGVSYTLHFQAIGATLYASAWQSNQAAPAQWMLVVSDMSLTSGLGGIRVVEQPAIVIQVSSFLETTVSSGI